jgi:hypothetical protein
MMPCDDPGETERPCLRMACHISVRVAKLMTFRRSKVLDVDDDMYPIS